MKKFIFTIFGLVMFAQFYAAAQTSRIVPMTNMTGSLSIIIKEPTPVLVFQANTNFINLSGVFFSSNEVHNIFWQNSQGGEGDCSFDHKSNRWYKNHLDISDGTNIITVTIKDEHTNSASDYIIVLYNTFGAIDTNPP